MKMFSILGRHSPVTIAAAIGAILSFIIALIQVNNSLGLFSMFSMGMGTIAAGFVSIAVITVVGSIIVMLAAWVVLLVQRRLAS